MEFAKGGLIRADQNPPELGGCTHGLVWREAPDHKPYEDVRPVQRVKANAGGSDSGNRGGGSSGN